MNQHSEPFESHKEAGYTFTLQKPLPIEIRVGADRWLLAVSYDHKGRHAELRASNGQRSGSLLSGRTRAVEASLRRPITVPAGTIRHALARALVASGAAREGA